MKLIDLISVYSHSKDSTISVGFEDNSDDGLFCKVDSKNLKILYDYPVKSFYFDYNKILQVRLQNSTETHQNSAETHQDAPCDALLVDMTNTPPMKKSERMRASLRTFIESESDEITFKFATKCQYADWMHKSIFWLSRLFKALEADQKKDLKINYNSSVWYRDYLIYLKKPEENMFTIKKDWRLKTAFNLEVLK